MRIRTSGSRIRLSGKISSGAPVSSGPLLGSIYRVTNISDISTDNLTYLDINGQTENTPTLNPGETIYILAQSSSLSDNENSGNSGQLCITDLLISSQELPTFTTFVSSSAGNFTFVKPTGVTYLVIECWGAGGAGGGSTINTGAGGGGGGGGYARSKINYASEQTNIDFQVGTGGIASTGDGNNGTNTIWGINEVVAIGGYGGKAPIASNSGGDGGFGGGSENGFFVNPNIGTITYIGGPGANGSGDSASGAGGGAAGSSIGGSGASPGSSLLGTSIRGNGGNEFGGDGADSSGTVGVNFTGLIGNNYGGGGSGAQKVTGGNRNGGAGAHGLLILTYVQP